VYRELPGLDSLNREVPDVFLELCVPWGRGQYYQFGQWGLEAFCLPNLVPHVLVRQTATSPMQFALCPDIGPLTLTPPIYVHTLLRLPLASVSDRVRVVGEF